MFTKYIHMTSRTILTANIYWPHEYKYIVINHFLQKRNDKYNAIITISGTNK